MKAVLIMITQIYSLQYVKEALAVIDAGADFIGILTGDRRCPGAISMKRAKEIFQAIDGKAVKVAILMVRDEEKVLKMAEELKPDILHLCDDRVFATEEFCHKAKKRIPGLKIMQAVGVTGPESIIDAQKYSATADYLILDSFQSGNNIFGAQPVGIGAAGVPHDWNISAKIVQSVNIPVILAGGLDENNVADAIKAVNPFGVDSLSKTTIIENGKYLYKDMEKVKKFIKNAHIAVK